MIARTEEERKQHALAKLEDRERAALILYSRGGAEGVSVELGIPIADVEQEIERIKTKVSDAVANEDERLARLAERQEHEEEEPEPGDDLAPEPLDEPTSHDPRRNPILEAMAELGRPTTAAEIAQMLDPPRQTGNVSTRLRQMEDEDPPRVRRTGNTANHGVRGGPQVEWELATAGDEPTRPGQPLTSPHSPPPRREEMRRLYFDALLAKFEGADGDQVEALADRIEKILETA